MAPSCSKLNVLSIWNLELAGNFINSRATVGLVSGSVSEYLIFREACNMATLRIIFNYSFSQACCHLLLVVWRRGQRLRLCGNKDLDDNKLPNLKSVEGSGRHLAEGTIPLFARMDWEKRWETSVSVAGTPDQFRTGHFHRNRTGQKCYRLLLSSASFSTNLISNQSAAQTSHLTTAGDNFVLQWAPDRPTERLPAGSHYWSMTVTKQETRSSISFSFTQERAGLHYIH